MQDLTRPASLPPAGAGLLLGIDTGGTYTDAVLLDAARIGEGPAALVATAKSLTTHADLARGIGGALDAVMRAAGIAAGDVSLVSLSTTLATNAVVEGQGAPAALVMIGFDDGDLGRQGLAEARGGDPLIAVGGGHDAHGTQRRPLDLAALARALDDLPARVAAVAICAHFATRNPEHERLARALVRERTGLPVTCSHELTAAIGGPRRALTALLNARLTPVVARLMAAADAMLTGRGIRAPLMVVRGDGALMSAGRARLRPVETILSGPAASLVGAGFLTGVRDAVVADIGGTTTDIAVVSGGRPALDPEGATVGGFRTMVEAVAMTTHGLGGDSEVHLDDRRAGLALTLGPRRVMPVCRLAALHGVAVREALGRQLARRVPDARDGRFVFAVPDAAERSSPAGVAERSSPPGSAERPPAADAAERSSPAGAAAGHPAAGATGPGAAGQGAAQPAPSGAAASQTAEAERALLDRLAAGPVALAELGQRGRAAAALRALTAAGRVGVAAFTPTDAAHVAGLHDAWDAEAAGLAAQLMARRRGSDGREVAPDGAAFAAAVLDAVVGESARHLLDVAFARDGIAGARGPLAEAALGRHAGLVRVSLSLGVPVVGLGAGAGLYYPRVGALLGSEAVVPEHAGVANAVGAVAGHVRVSRSASVTVPAEGRYRLHLPEGRPPADHTGSEAALAAAEAELRAIVLAEAAAAGAVDAEATVDVELREAEIEGRRMLVEAVLTATAIGRPRLAVPPEPAAPPA